MNIKVTGHHFELSDAIRNYTEEKLNKLERIYNGITNVDVILKDEDRKLHCEIIIHVSNKPDTVIDVAHDSMYAAIDLASDKAQRQLKRIKGKIQDHRPSKAPAPAMEAVESEED